MSLRENLKSKRLENRLTLEDVANKIGVNRQTVQKYESGLISNVPSDKIEKMAEIYNTTPAFLMGWGETNESIVIADAILRYTKEIDSSLMLELLKKFNKLSEEDRSLALQLISKMDRGGK